MAIASWDLGPDPDMSELWASTATPPSGYDVSGGAADPFLDQDLETLATVGQEAQRASAAARVAADLATDAPAVFLYAPEESLVVSKQALLGERARSRRPLRRCRLLGLRAGARRPPGPAMSGRPPPATIVARLAPGWWNW